MDKKLKIILILIIIAISFVIIRKPFYAVNLGGKPDFLQKSLLINLMGPNISQQPVYSERNFIIIHHTQHWAMKRSHFSEKSQKPWSITPDYHNIKQPFCCEPFFRSFNYLFGFSYGSVYFSLIKLKIRIPWSFFWYY